MNQEFIESVIKEINKQHAISLYGERGVGKSRTALVLKQQLEQQDYLVAYCDCGLIVQNDDLWRLIADKFNLSISGGFEKLCYTFTEAITKILHKKLIIFDEFELLFSNPNFNDRDFAYLRAIIVGDRRMHCLVIGKDPIGKIMEYRDNCGSPLWNIFTSIKVS